MENSFQIISCLLLGIALSATCGFKVFVPTLLVSIGARAGWIELSSSFTWLESWPAILLLGTATIVEILTYYIPIVDNFIDTIAIPASVVAGTIIVASTMVADISPIMKWVLAIVAGGGSAAAVKTTSAAVKGISSMATAGFGNVIMNTLETICSILCSILALIFPLLVILAIVGVVIVGIHAIRKICHPKTTETIAV